MILASDLDRTIIHPLGEVARAGLPAPEVRVVEVYRGEAVSCMSERSIALLRELAARHRFVPVTTRTVAQYARIEVVGELAEWAVVANGATVLRDGEPDPEWAALHAGRVADARPIDSVRERMRALAAEGPDGWWLRQKEADDAFLYAIVDPARVPEEALAAFREELADGGWDVHLHGRKLYAIPAATNKHAAVRWLAERLGEDVVAVAGDSALDACLAVDATHAFCPAGSELAAAADRPEAMVLTSAEHVRATEEILERLLALRSPARTATPRT